MHLQKTSFNTVLMLLTPVIGFGSLYWLSLAKAQAPPPSSDVTQTRFPDFGFLPTPDKYTGPVFRLSQNYPENRPSTLPPFFQTDFQKDWHQYMIQVRDYCFQGNTAVDWRVEKNKSRPWFHMPWIHSGNNGREGVHGLNKEAPVSPGQLASSQTETNSVAWAIGFYNDFGGYTIGRVWKNHWQPDLRETTFPKGFAEGTVMCKLLFVSLPPDSVAQQVPSLANPIQWDAYISEGYSSQSFSMQKVTLIQMDIMVRDSRAPNGWIFGTFQYNGLLNNTNKWNNLIPVGLQFGNDPLVTTDTAPYSGSSNYKWDGKQTYINPNLKETIINPDPKELPPTHLGWNGRLNGPLDNERSSCMSCHSTAQYPALSGITPFFNKPTYPDPSSNLPMWMKWFQNRKCGTTMDKGTLSTDFSLQLSQAMQTFNDTVYNGALYAKQYDKGVRPANLPPHKNPGIQQVIRNKPPQ